jgi:ATP-dependent exoDNAse (exonuclease V) beta subunit
MLRIQDEQARATALDPARSFIVQAPAGSGKTELLTQRLLVLLARVEHPEEVVAITFTNKAAGEMRDRIVQALARARDPILPTESHRRRTWELARAVLGRDAERDWRLEHNPGRLRIRTIDSLCAALARAMPLTAGIGAEPQIVEDTHELYAEAARETIALLEAGGPWSAAVERLLRHLDNNWGEVERLVAEMLARRDQWLRHVAGGADNPRIERAQLETALRNVIVDALDDLAQAVPAEEAGEIVALADHAGTNLQQAGSTVEIVACAGLTQLPGAAPEDFDVWRGLAALLLTKEGGWRKQVNKNVGFAAPAGSGEAKRRAKETKERFEALLERLRPREEFRLRLGALRGLPNPGYEERQWEVLEALIAALPIAAAQLTLAFRRRGGVDFAAVAHAALAALGSADEPTDLALALDYRIRHVLVDEFQDTSFSQYELLERLTAGWQPGDGRTLFAVGDPMQSIYRFREAEVGLYLRARHQGIGSLTLEPLTLTVNFRSQGNVVQWVNDAFAHVLPAAEDLTFGAVPYAASIAQHAPLAGPAVSMHPFFDGSGMAEAQRVVELVRAARAADLAQNIAILVRARAHLDEIIPCLKRAGIRFLALDIEPLGHRQAVQDLLALTRALEHPADRVAWLALLRAPWCGMTLADLHVLCGDDHDAALWDLIGDPVRRDRLSADGQQRLGRLTEVLADRLANRRRQRLRRAVEGAWLALGGPACVRERADLEDAEVFFTLLDEFETAGDIADLARLEERVATLFALPDPDAADGAVQVMTVHKAKGLEFDTVIVPALGRPPARQGRQLLRWAERPRAHAAADLLLAPVVESGEEEDAIYRYLRRLDAERGRYEDGRLLYVAATRARRHLHLLGHVAVVERDGIPVMRDPAAGSLLATLWPAVHEEYERAVSRIETLPGTPAEAPATSTPHIERLSADWQPPAMPSLLTAATQIEPTAREAVEFDWAGETARHIGTVVHRYLLRIARDGVERWDATRVEALRPAFTQALEQLGVARAELAAASGRVLLALANTLRDERGRWLLDVRHEQARSEYAVTGAWEGGLVNVVLDRTFVDGQGVRWIVDYKTGVHTGGGIEEFLDREAARYRHQLERYATLMRALDSRPVRLGLYFPLLQGWREWSALV